MNKRKIYFIILILIQCLVSYAGINPNFAYYIGGTAYGESSNLSDSQKFNGTYGGFTGGILIELELNKYFSIEPGIGYSERVSSSKTGSAVDISHNRKARRYFVLPFDVKFTLDEYIKTLGESIKKDHYSSYLPPPRRSNWIL